MQAYKSEEIKMSNEGRIVRLETIIENINSNFISVREEMRGISKDIKDFAETTQKSFDKMNEKIDRNADATRRGFEHVEEKFNKRFERVESRIENVHEQSWSQFRWIFGSVFMLIVTLILKSFNFM